MRIEVTSGDKQVTVKVKGSSVAKLRAAEETARRLLDASPEPAPKPPIGFSTGSDTERAADEE